MTDLSQMSREQLEAMVLAMAAKQHKALSMKVTEKGGVSVYGLGRFPVTLYQGQWARLLGAKDEIETFIDANKPLLSVKGE